MKRRLTLLLIFSLTGLGAVFQPPSPEALRAKSENAALAMKDGDYEKAISLYRELARELADLPGPRMNLGIAYYMAGQFQSAIRELENLPGQGDEWTPALLFAGASHLRLDDPRAAIPPLRRYVKAEPSDSRGKRMLADALLSVHNFSEAAGILRDLVAVEPMGARLWHSLGKCYESLARKSFEDLERSAPESAYVLALLADSRVSLRQYQSAFFLYRKALEKEPIRGLHVAVAQLYLSTGHPDWAAIEQQKELDRGLPDCETERLVCDFLSGKFLEVVESGEQSPAALYWRSKAYDLLARDAFSRLTQLPPSFEMHQLAAEVHRNNGRHKDAAKEWKRALELSPGNPVAEQELALSLFLSRDYDEAEPLVERLLKRHPGSAELNYLAGAILMERQQPEEATPLLEKALRIDSRLGSAHSALGRAYLDTGEPEKAIPHLEVALEADQDGSVHYQISRAYRSLGRLEEAAESLLKYQEIQKALQEERATMAEEVKISPP